MFIHGPAHTAAGFGGRWSLWASTCHQLSHTEGWASNAAPLQGSGKIDTSEQCFLKLYVITTHSGLWFILFMLKFPSQARDVVTCGQGGAVCHPRWHTEPVPASQLSCSSHTADDLAASSDKSTALFTPSSILFDYFVLI